MFELRVKVEFAAAHHIKGYPGDCARQHGHNWYLELFVRSKKLDDNGLAVDFRLLKKAAREVVSGWDHRDLNELEDFRAMNPTAENLAKLAYERLSAIIDGESVWVHSVRIWENENSFAAYHDESKRFS